LPSHFPRTTEHIKKSSSTNGHAPGKIMRTAELRCLTKIISELLLDLKNTPAWVLLHETTGDKIDI
jgi:hypothetical protein